MNYGAITEEEFEKLTNLPADTIEPQSIPETNFPLDSDTRINLHNRQMAQYNSAKKKGLSIATIACYAIAAVIAVYVIVSVFSTVSQINDYYSQYGMSASLKEYIEYIFQNNLTPLTSAVLIAMAGKINNMIEKSNLKD